jgi:hypothetical protein
MLVRFRLLALLLCAGLALPACDSNAPDDRAPTIGGLYTTSATQDGVTATVTLDVPSTREGAFTLGERSAVAYAQGGTTLSFEVTGSGTYDFPDITLNATAHVGDAPQSGQWTGTVSASGGTITVHDEEGTEYVLTRD